MPYDGSQSFHELSFCDKQHRLNVAANGYAHQVHKTFTAIPDIEGIAPHKLLLVSTKGTILEPAVTALNQAGIPTPQTVDGIMGSLGLNSSQVHDLACECHGDEVTGGVMKMRFEMLAVSAAAD